MNDILNNLEKKTIDTTSTNYVETITLACDSSNYEQGFKIYYNDEFDVISIRCWKVSLIPDSSGRYYKDTVVSPDAFSRIVAWRMGKDYVTTNSVRERQILFPKKIRVMTES